MSLTLTPDVVDRTLPTSVANQLADHLRQAIADHDLNPGDIFPSEDELVSATGLARGTVRESLLELELEGLIMRRMGARTIVAIPPAVRYYDVLRYARTTEALDHGETPHTAFVEDFGAREEDHVIDPVEITREPASAQDVEYLGVRIRTPILRRRLVDCLRSQDPKTGEEVIERIQIHRQAMVYKRVKDAELARVVNPRGGILTELRAAGIRPTHCGEFWRPRNPNRTERDLLGLRITVPVWEGVRIFIEAEDPAAEDLAAVGHSPIQVSKLITPGNRMTLHVSGRLAPGPPVAGTSDH